MEKSDVFVVWTKFGKAKQTKGKRPHGLQVSVTTAVINVTKPKGSNETRYAVVGERR